MEFGNDEVIKYIENRVGYKYLRISETDGFKNLEIKEKVRKEYFYWIKKILKSKLNSGNIAKVINYRTVAVMKYGARGVLRRNERLCIPN